MGTLATSSHSLLALAASVALTFHPSFSSCTWIWDGDEDMVGKLYLIVMMERLQEMCFNNDPGEDIDEFV